MIVTAVVVYAPTILELILALISVLSGSAKSAEIDRLIDRLEDTIQAHIDQGKPAENNHDIKSEWTNLMRRFRFDIHHRERLAQIKDNLASLGIFPKEQPKRRGFFQGYSKY